MLVCAFVCLRIRVRACLQQPSSVMMAKRCVGAV